MGRKPSPFRPPPPRRLPPARSTPPPRDEDDTYIGATSTFVTDPRQWLAVVVFSAFLGGFFALGNLGAAVWLSNEYHRPLAEVIKQGFSGGQKGLL